MATSLQDQQNLAQIGVLNNLNDDQMTQYAQLLIGFIIDTTTQNTAESQEKLASFISTNGLKRSYETAFYLIVNILIDHIKQNNSFDIVQSSLQNTQLQPSHASIVLQFYQRNSETIHGLLSENVFKLSKLLGIEWRFGVTTSSSSLSQIGTCFLQLKLSALKNGKPSTSIVEMTLPQFYSFLAALQKAALTVGNA